MSWCRPRQSLNLDTLGVLFPGVFSPKAPAIAGPEGSGLVQCSAQCTIQCSVIKTRIFPPILGRNFEVSPEVQEQNSVKTPGLFKTSQNLRRFWGAEISPKCRRNEKDGRRYTVYGKEKKSRTKFTFTVYCKPPAVPHSYDTSAKFRAFGQILYKQCSAVRCSAVQYSA